MPWLFVLVRLMPPTTETKTSCPMYVLSVYFACTDVTRRFMQVQSMGGGCEFKEEDCGCVSGEAGCQMPDVKDVCMGRSSCRLDVTQQYIGTGACHGFSDYMYIEFTCLPGMSAEVTCPPGMSGEVTCLPGMSAKFTCLPGMSAELK